MKKALHTTRLEENTEEREPPEPAAHPDDIFYQLNQEAACLERELAEYAAGQRRSHSFPQHQIDTLIQLKQFPALFQPAFDELIPVLPVQISVRPRSTDFGVSMSSFTTDLPSSHYARFRCIYADEAAPSPGPRSGVSSPQCEVWTFIPYVQDTYLRGLAKVLSTAANTNVEGDELEAELAAGFKLMFCSAHQEALKDHQASVFAIKCRPVVERWRENQELYYNVGKLHSTDTRAAIVALH